MPRTIGYHLVKSAYGMWGHWSSAWDEKIGFYQPHHLPAGDPSRERMAKERQTFPAARFTFEIIQAIADAVGKCMRESDWGVEAAAIEPTHMHLLLTYSERDIDGTVK
jgi:hypothetical protein